MFWFLMLEGVITFPSFLLHISIPLLLLLKWLEMYESQPVLCVKVPEVSLRLFKKNKLHHVTVYNMQNITHCILLRASKCINANANLASSLYADDI